ncbi:MAG: hypothetical protein HY741_12575 [Chloroflexi bacterium]|nr:hypothetical protein [Chloroflexota bacterium]
MSSPHLQLLIGTALTDPAYCKALLNGSRRTLLQALPLTSAEIETIMAIRAETLEQFASELHTNLVAPVQEPEIEPLPYRSWQVRTR